MRTRSLAGLALALLLTACTGTSAPAEHTSSPAKSSPESSAAASPVTSVTPATTDWLEYHGNGTRTGSVAGLPAAGPLAIAWSARLGGAVYGQPLVVGDTVIAATETDEVYGLNRSTGAVRWQVKVGTSVPLVEQPCGDIGPLGITGTGVYDPQTQLAYFVAQSGRATHILVGVDPTDGSVRFSRQVPSPDHQPFYDQQRGALALTDGRVYVVFGGHYGDCGPYIGSVVSVPVTGTGGIGSYLVPTAQQGGIWSSGGPVVSSDGTIYVSVGNGATSSGSFDGSDSVTALTPQLARVGIFAPTDWRKLSANDLDFGSTSPALLADGQILQVGKDGTGYLLNAANLGGVGGQVASGQVCPASSYGAFGGPAVLGTVVYEPCLSGLTAVNTGGGQVKVSWRGPAGTTGSPVIGGGAVWVANTVTGQLDELAPGTGAIRQRIRLGGPLPHFESPSLSGGLVLTGTLSGVVAVSGA